METFTAARDFVPDPRFGERRTAALAVTRSPAAARPRARATWSDGSTTASSCARLAVMGLTVRPYRPEDWRRLCAVHDAARVDELAAAGLGDAFLSLEQTYENEALFAGEVAVAVVEGEVVGFVAWTADELTWLYVDPSHYHQGVGRALLRHALAALKSPVTAEVLTGNEVALALYLSEGFRVLRRSDGRLVGNEAFPASAFVLERPAEAGVPPARAGGSEGAARPAAGSTSPERSRS